MRNTYIKRTVTSKMPAKTKAVKTVWKFVAFVVLLVSDARSLAVAKAPGPTFTAVIAHREGSRQRPKLVVQLDDQLFLVPLTAQLVKKGWMCLIKPDDEGKDNSIRHIQCINSRVDATLGTVFECGDSKNGVLGIGTSTDSTIITVWCAS